MKEGLRSNHWPCLLTMSDTTGEKEEEEFYTQNEEVDLDRFMNIGVIKNEMAYDPSRLNGFLMAVETMKSKGNWSKHEIIDLFQQLIPDFDHRETGKYLDSKM